jgi:hypothetical protein
MSVKFLLTVAEPAIAEWKHAAEVTGISVAELIRQAMTDFLRENPQRNRKDPFEAITSLMDSAEVDLAGRVDEALYR